MVHTAWYIRHEAADAKCEAYGSQVHDGNGCTVAPARSRTTRQIGLALTRAPLRVVASPGRAHRQVKLPLISDLLDLVDVESARRARDASRAAELSRAKSLPGYSRPLGSSPAAPGSSSSSTTSTTPCLSSSSSSASSPSSSSPSPSPSPSSSSCSPSSSSSGGQQPPVRIAGLRNRRTVCFSLLHGASLDAAWCFSVLCFVSLVLVRTGLARVCGVDTEIRRQLLLFAWGVKIVCSWRENDINLHISQARNTQYDANNATIPTKNMMPTTVQ